MINRVEDQGSFKVLYDDSVKLLSKYFPLLGWSQVEQRLYGK